MACKSGKRFDGLPDWVWSQDGFEFSGFVPKCIDPTYCLTDPPEPRYLNAIYEKPTQPLKFGDGEIVSYKCKNSSETFLKMN